MDGIYVLTNQEFVILAAAAGIKKLYGFDMKSGEIERENAIYILQDFTRQGFAEVREEKIQLTGPMSEIFEQIRNAETYLEIHKRSGRKCILYIGERVIKVSQSLRRNDTYEVSEIINQNAWESLQEEGWIPKTEKGWDREKG